MGPWLGWLGGWAIAMTGVLIVASLADTAVRFGLLALGLDSAADNYWIVTLLTILVVLVMTAICVLGTELSAKLQNVLIVPQVVSLLVFAAIALFRAVTGDSSLDSINPSFSWLNPFGEGGRGPDRRPAARRVRLLGLGVGGQSAPRRRPTPSPRPAGPRSSRRSSCWSPTSASPTRSSPTPVRTSSTENQDEEEYIFGLLSTEVMGGWDWVVLLSVSTAAIASTQTTILPGLPHRPLDGPPRRSATAISRTSTRGSAPRTSLRGGSLSSRSSGTSWSGRISENALFDTLTALSLLIAFYYALTGIACAVYYRRHLTESAKNFLLIGVGPLIGSAMLIWLLIESIFDLSDPANSYSEQAWFGLGPPLVIGIGVFALGVVLMFIWRSQNKKFWEERPGVADPDLVYGRATAEPDPLDG